MVDVKEAYGIEPMTFDEEIALWRNHESQAQTRNNKRRMITSLRHIADMCIYYENIFKLIPEEDEPIHSNRVDLLREELDRIDRDFCSLYDRHARI